MARLAQRRDGDRGDDGAGAVGGARERRGEIRPTRTRRLAGVLAWLLWSVAHVYFLIGFRNRFTVAMNWAWSYITFQRGSRLITGLYASRMEDMLKPERVELRSKAG